MLLMSDEFQLAAFLEASGRNVSEVRAGEWKVAAGRRRKLRGTVSQQSEWISLEFPWQASESDDPARPLIDLATRCGELPTSLKFSRAHAESHFDVRCEVRIAGDSYDTFGTRHEDHEADHGRQTPLSERLESLLQTIDQVLDGGLDSLDASSKREVADGSSRTQEAPRATTPGARSELARMCDEAGWSCHERAGGRVAVPLDVSGLFCEAIVSPHESGGLRVEYTLDGGERSRVASAASSLFLLRANRVYRMARLSMTYSPASARTVDSGEVAGGLSGVRFVWDVVLPGPAGPADLNAALSALSVACRGTVRELQVLAGDQVAREYLAIQGMVL